ncbi:hypothetical protein K3495_g2809 [Podosphaera aphanis]|nr:hypothetical protein K3495_g2809 [Podosphaera aphanis]
MLTKHISLVTQMLVKPLPYQHQQQTPQLCLCFAGGKKESDSKWVLRYIAKFYNLNSFQDPTFVSDRELAPMKADGDVLPEAYHICCRWHVNMNVVAETKKYFTVHEDWLAIINATMEEDHEMKLAVFKKYRNAIECCIGALLGLWKEKIVRIPVFRYLLWFLIPQ